jgi:cobalt-zinc-cadmium efflux system protein
MAEHNHDHNHDITEIKSSKLFLVIALNFLITIAEIVAGIISGSLSLISDSLHNLSDCISLVISYFAIKISKKENDYKRTFGYKRSTILAALLNASILIVISVFLFKEAYGRFISPQSVDGLVMIWVALLAIFANAAGVFLLQKGSKGDLNIKASYIHLLSDALASVGVVIGGIFILLFKVYWIDAALTVLISFYVLIESYKIIKKAINILMQGVPENIDIESIVADIEKIENVEKVHHVHVWSIDENNINFEAHVDVTNMMITETKRILDEIEHSLLHHGINHSTIQLECERCTDGACIIDTKPRKKVK